MTIKKIISAQFILFSAFICAQTSVPDDYLRAGYGTDISGSALSAKEILLTPKEQLTQEISVLQQDPVLRYAHWGYAVYDPKTKKLITGYNESVPLKPASTTKLLTTDTAYSIFGTKYQWITQLEYSGILSEEGVLDGNLYIVGSGDPSLGSTQSGASSYWAIVTEYKDAIRNAGIKRIKGNIIIQSGVFKTQNMLLPPHIVWMEHNNYYLPVGNTQDVKPEDERSVIREKGPLSTIKRYFYISPYTQKAAYTDSFQAISSLSGKLPSAPAYLANQLRSSLLKSGISVGSVITKTIDDSPEERVFLASTKSPNLEDLIYFTNQTSNNKMAEALLHISGFYQNGDFGLESGKEAIYNHLKKLDFDFNGLSFIDGSGLSHSHRVTPIAQVKFLAHLMEQPYFKSYFESLPIAGHTGTLKNMFVYNEANGQIFAKTGTLNKVKTLAGYIKTKSGRTLTFSLLINDYSGSVAQVKKKMEELLQPTLNL